MIVLVGDPRLLDYVNWDLLIQFTEEESTTFLPGCVLHQMTLLNRLYSVLWIT
jgi:hypothetical protein